MNGVPDNPALAIHLLTYALLAAITVVSYFAYLLRECRCSSCAFHKTERLQKAAKAKAEAESEARRQADLRHEYEHKGGGFLPGDPDRFNCHDEACRRNRQ